MNCKEAIEAIVVARVRQLGPELDGELHGDFDADSLEIVVSGWCRKVHPDLRDRYPNGWALLHRESIDNAMGALGAELNLAVPHG